ncbi:MAG: hypothetical protein WCC97_02040 [Candidatus Acidiferrales bacterium]
MPITLNWIATPEQLKAKLNGRWAGAVDALYRQMQTSMGNLLTYIQTTKLQGFPLHHRSGNLIRSLKDFAAQSPGQISGKVFVSNTTLNSKVDYAKIHEFGGTFTARRQNLIHPPHLVTRAGGERVMTGSPYGIHFPERSFMRSSLREQRQVIITALSTALSRSLK